MEELDRKLRVERAEAEAAAQRKASAGSPSTGSPLELRRSPRSASSPLSPMSPTSTDSWADEQRPLPQLPSTMDEASRTTGWQHRAIALYSFQAQTECDLSFSEGPCATPLTLATHSWLWY